MSVFSKIKEFTSRRKLRKIHDLSNAILRDIQNRDARELDIGIPGKTAVKRVPSNVVPFKPLNKNKAAKDRELIMDGTYLNKYNFGDLYAAYTKETYFKVAVDKYVEGIVQRGFHYDSKTQQAVDYIRKRVREMGITSSKGIRDILRDLAFSLLVFGNAFLVRVRDPKRSSGLSHNWRGKDVKPISGWYVADPRRVVIREKRRGTGIEYLIVPRKVRPIRSRIENVWAFLRNLPGLSSTSSVLRYGTSGLLDSEEDAIILKEEDVEHIRYHHTPGEKWAMPPFWPVLDDINILRSTETAVDLLIYQFGSLLIHVQVSNPTRSLAQAAMTRPARKEDIDDMKAKLDEMESNGFIVTGDHVDMEVLQVAGNILRLGEYLEYFKGRVFSGLWISPVIIGESGKGMSRSVADTIVDEKISKMIEIQSILSTAVDALFIEFLLEAGLSYGQANRENVVTTLVFDDVDIELELKKRESTLRLWEAGLLTEHEGRRYLGLDEMTDEEREFTYPRIVKEHLIQVEQEAKMGVVMAQAQVALSRAKAARSKSSPASRKAANKITPANQHGRKLNSKKAVNR